VSGGRLTSRFTSGEVAERSKAAVLKDGSGDRRIPLQIQRVRCARWRRGCKQI
jgi:hypothetical protein